MSCLHLRTPLDVTRNAFWLHSGGLWGPPDSNPWIRRIHGSDAFRNKDCTYVSLSFQVFHLGAGSQCKLGVTKEGKSVNHITTFSAFYVFTKGTIIQQVPPPHLTINIQNVRTTRGWYYSVGMSRDLSLSWTEQQFSPGRKTSLHLCSIFPKLELITVSPPPFNIGRERGEIMTATHPHRGEALMLKRMKMQSDGRRI